MKHSSIPLYDLAGSIRYDPYINGIVIVRAIVYFSIILFFHIGLRSLDPSNHSTIMLMVLLFKLRVV
jgi:hypothetical protein